MTPARAPRRRSVPARSRRANPDVIPVILPGRDASLGPSASAKRQRAVRTVLNGFVGVLSGGRKYLGRTQTSAAAHRPTGRRRADRYLGPGPAVDRQPRSRSKIRTCASTKRSFSGPPESAVFGITVVTQPLLVVPTSHLSNRVFVGGNPSARMIFTRTHCTRSF